MTESDAISQLSAQTLWAAAADGLILVDADGCIRATNDRTDELFGYSTGSLVGRDIDELVPDDHRQAHHLHRIEYEAAPVTRPMAASQSLLGLRRDGSEFPINVSLARLPLPEGEMTVAAVRDLTDRVAVETKLAAANRQRALAQDHDRIASELHDTVIQRLFALGLNMQGLPDSIEDPEIADKVYSAVDTIDAIISDIRNTIYGLRRDMPTNLGLRQQVLGVVGEMEASLGFAPTVEFVGPVESVEDEATIQHLLPVLRESLSNVARHAGATWAAVRLLLDDELHLEVHDDGRGIPKGIVRSGLGNIAERAVALAGSFTIESAEPSGTILKWSVPIAD